MTEVLDRIGEQLVSAERSLWAGGGVRRARSSTRTGGAMRFWLRRHLVVGLALIGASGTAAGIAVAASLSDQSISPQDWINGQRVQPEAAIAPDQLSQLGIFRRPRVASDVLPAAEAQALTNSPSAASGVNVELSRSAQGLTTGVAWLIPGDGMICFAYGDSPVGGGGTCQPDAVVTAGQLVETSGGSTVPGTTVVAGVVPDGVSQVTLNLANGDATSVSVHENVYLTTISGTSLTSVTFVGPNGPETNGLDGQSPG